MEAVPQEVRQEMAVSKEVVPAEIVPEEMMLDEVVLNEVVLDEVVPKEVVPEEVSPTAVVPKVAWHAAAQAAGWTPPATPGQKRERPSSIEKEFDGPQRSRLASFMDRFRYSLS